MAAGELKGSLAAFPAAPLGGTVLGQVDGGLSDPGGYHLF